MFGAFFKRVWSNLTCNVDQFRAKLGDFDQFWAKLGDFDQFWAKLGDFDQFWAKFGDFAHSTDLCQTNRNDSERVLFVRDTLGERSPNMIISGSGLETPVYVI
jgi:hypothetical protein